MARLTGNPTRTRTIERNWFREIRRRWTAYTRSVLPALVRENQLALRLNQEGDPFVLSPAQIRVYMDFIYQQIDDLLLGTENPPNWQAEYQFQSYARGLKRYRAQLRRQGAEIEPTPEERLEAEGLRPLTATPSLATSTIPQVPIHRDALEFLFTRSYETLEGWTDTLARETRQILVDAVEAGKGIREVTREIRDRIGVSRRRAERIARTEVNQAYSRSSLTANQRAREETGIDIKVRWITAIVKTAKGNPVRHNHARLHGLVIEPEEAAQVKREDGVYCRCALAPVVPGTNTPARQAFFEAQRRQALAITAASS